MHFEPLEMRTLLAVFTVTNTSDVDDLGPGTDANVSLREAMRNANTNPTPDTINFNIPTSDPGFNGEWWTIRLNSQLPELINSGTTINGFSQPAAGTNTLVGTGGTVGVDEVPFPQFQQPEIAIDGNVLAADPNPTALVIDGGASNILIKGMAIYDVGLPPSSDSDVAILGQGFPAGGTNRVIESMFVGLLPDGSDPGLGERNIGFGVRQQAGGELTVTKSYVGFNGRGGLDAEANNSVVTFTYNEVFESGWASQTSAHDGIDINGINSIARYNLSRDNTTLATAPIPNGGGGNGIELGSLSVKGIIAGNFVENNTIFGNVSAGVSARNGASGNTIRKNVIFDNEVGISVNTEQGSQPNHTYRNRISQNSIYMNMGLGIDLQHQGTDAVQWVGSPDGGNDTELTGQDHLGCDADNGSNDLQNYPILSSVIVFSGSTTIEGTLISTPSTTFTIEFFSTPDGTLFTLGDREGKDFIGSIQVTTDAMCMATFSHTFATAVTDDDVITATATKFTDANTPWSTSEFSPAVPVAEITLQEKVTGGGWYNQPATGTPMPTSTDDRANFGFNAQYKKTNPVPQGVTNFRYRPANLHFLSTSYAELSLIVTEISPGVHRATWRGLGKVNNVSGYGFRADVTDAGEPGTSDTFHIKIWQEVDQDPFTEEPLIVYDNDPTSTGTVLGGGNIQVHMRPNALLADAVEGSLEGTQTLTEEALETVVAEAIAWWRDQGVDEAALAHLADAQVLVATLPDAFLGVAANGVIGIDQDAAGLGWSLNASTLGGVDLLTVVTHELGHLLGFEHDDDHESVMAATLQPGVRLFAEYVYLLADAVASDPLTCAGAITLAVNVPLQNEAVYLPVTRAAVAISDTTAAFANPADPVRAVWWHQNVWDDDVTAAAVRDAFDTELAAWLIADRVIALAPRWPAEARTSSARPTEILPTGGGQNRGKRPASPVAPANAGEDSDQERALAPNEEGEPQPANEVPTDEHSSAEIFSAALVPCQACEAYFASEHWEVDLQEVAAMAAGMAIVVGGREAIPMARLPSLHLNLLKRGLRS